MLRIVDRGPFNTVIEANRESAFDIGQARAGVNETQDIFFRLDEKGNVEWVASRVCDHSNGKLCMEGDAKSARCPFHGWRLNLETLSYENVQVMKKTLPFRQDGTRITYVQPQSCLAVPERLQSKVPSKAQIRFLAHACVELRLSDLSIITDPWLIGPCFATGWWHSVPPPGDALEILRAADFVYLSHNHPDHMHVETLHHIDRNKTLLVPKFTSASVSSLARDLGFTNVRALEFGRIYEIEEKGVYVSIFPAGDFRDDSGLWVAHGDFSALLAVDSNRLNNYVLPKPASLLLTAFASGASGFPLCFDMYPQKHKEALLARNRNAILSGVEEYVGATAPLAYMPYAGYFSELAERDGYIKGHNVKNTPERAIEAVIAKFPGTMGINPTVTDVITWSDGKFDAHPSGQPPLFSTTGDYVDHWIKRLEVPREKFNVSTIADYFRNSGFQDDFRLYVVPADDRFEPDNELEGVIVDFSNDVPFVEMRRAVDIDKQYEEDAGPGQALRLKRMRVRAGILMYVVTHGLPMEDLSIGFQCRFHRTPDVYNSKFWFHFTNNYIGKRVSVTS